MRIAAVAALIFALLITGCASYPVPQYSASAENVRQLQTVQVGAVSLGEFSTAAFAAGCRGLDNIVTASGQPIGAYVQAALREELVSAGVKVALGAPVTLFGRVSPVEFSSAADGSTAAGRWRIGLDLTSSNGRSARADVTHEFPTVFHGQIGCQMVANALVPAVQKLLGQMFRSPEFPPLLR